MRRNLIASPQDLIYLKLTLVALFWGGTFIAGRHLAETLAPITAAASRFSVAVALLLLLAWRLEGGLPRLSFRQFLITGALGLTGIFSYNIGFFGALSEMPASRTAVFVAFNPIVTVLLLAILFRERLPPLKALGILLALCGAIIVISRGDVLAALQDLGGLLGKGELYMLAAVLSWAIYTIIGRHAMSGLTPLAATTYAALWGLAMLLISLAFEQGTGTTGQINWLDWASIIYLGALGTVVAFVWYYQGVRMLGPARTAVFTNLVPVFGVLLGIIILDEQPTLSLLLGTALVISGVTLTNRR